MTFLEAIASIGPHDYDTCITLDIRNENEFKFLEVSLSKPRQLSVKYGSRDNANVFYYYPIDGYYGHYNLDELKTHASVIELSNYFRKHKTLSLIKYYKE